MVYDCFDIDYFFNTMGIFAISQQTLFQIFLKKHPLSINSKN